MDNLQENKIDGQDVATEEIPMPLRRPINKLPYDLTNEGMGSVFGGWPEPKETVEEKTPALKTAYLEAKKQSVLYNAQRTGLGFLQSEYNFLFDNVDKDFDTNNPDLYKDIPEIYWPTIRNATSPADLKRRQNIVAEEMENEKLLENGGFWPKLIGGGFGMTIGSGPLGVSKWVLPAISESRAGTFTVDALMNTAKEFPGIAVDALSYESALDLSKGRYDVEDVAIRSLEDAAFGFGLKSLGKTLAYGNDGIKIWNGRKLVGAMYHDAKIEPVFDGDKLVELKYTPPIKEAMSAKRAAEIEGDLRTIVAETGFYGIHIVGKGLKEVTKLANPAFRMLSSPFEDARNFFSGISHTGIRTKGELEGTARVRSAEEFSSYYRAMGTRHRMEYQQDFYAANGMTSSSQTVNAFKNLVQTFSEKKNISSDEFGSRVRDVLATGIDDENPYINRAARRMNAILEDVNRAYAEAHGIDEFITPKNTVEYIFQNWQNNKLKYSPDDFFTIGKQYLSQKSDEIAEIMRPLDEMDRMIKEAPDFQKEALRVRREEIKSQIHDKLTDNEDNHFLLKDKVVLNSKHRAELKKLLDDAGLTQLNEEIKTLKEELKTAEKDRKTEINKRMKQLYDERKAANEKLSLDARLGRINKKYFYKDKGKIKFRDPNKFPEFIETYKTKEGQINYLKRFRAKIMGTNASDLMDEVLGHGEHSANPMYTRERSFLIPQQILNSAGYLDNDLASAMENYLGSMGRRIGLKRAFGEMYGERGIEDIFERMAKDRVGKEERIFQIKDEKLQQKKLKRLNKDYESAVNDMTAIYAIYNGRYKNVLMNKNESLNAPMQIMRNLVYASKLGALPIAQLTDSVAAILRTGIVPWLYGGVMPHLRSWKSAFKGNKSEIQESAAVSLLGLNHVIGEKQYDYFSKGTHNYDTTLGKLANASDFIANKSQNLSFANYFENINESIAERTMQSYVIRASKRFLDGTITKSETVQMARMGLDMAEDARAIIDQFNKYGESHYGGRAYNSKYEDWDNADIQEKMILSVRSGVADVVVKGQMFTSPLFMKDPVIGSLFMFTSWGFAATERYLLPSLQYADANTLQGIIAISIMSSIQDPLRRMVAGKEPFEDEASVKDIILNTIMQNGFFGVLPSAVESLNLIAHNDLLGRSQGFRYKERTGLGGPLVDYAHDAADSAYMLLSGKINKTGVKKTMNLLPVTGNVYVRGLLNAWREGLDIPDTFSEAEPYKIFQKD